VCVCVCVCVWNPGMIANAVGVNRVCRLGGVSLIVVVIVLLDGYNGSTTYADPTTPIRGAVV
jgi:hypothetical protein